MDKKEPKHLKEEHSHPKKEATCNCGPDCKCGCQEGGECHCGENGCCHCGCGCPCKRKAAKLLGAILIFALGFCAAKVIGCKPCMKRFPCPKAGMNAPMPMMPHYTDGAGNTIIIINTDGNADVSRFLGKPHHDCNCGEKCDCHKNHKHGKHHKMNGKHHPHFDGHKPTPEQAMPENVQPRAPMPAAQ